MRAIVKILMLFDHFRSVFEEMTPKVLKFHRVHKVFGMLFLSAAKACLANGFNVSECPENTMKMSENPNAFWIIPELNLLK